jgi:hypothetical protein
MVAISTVNWMGEELAGKDMTEEFDTKITNWGKKRCNYWNFQFQFQ